MDADCCKVRIGLDHGYEFLEGVGVFSKGRHLNHESGENFLLQDFAGDREFTLHEGVPLLETVDRLDIGLDVHLAVADLGVVHIVGAAHDIGLAAMAFPHLFGNRNTQAGHAFSGFTKTASKTAELKTGF